MRILVLGASGGVGRHLLVRGRARGHAIRAQTRDRPRLADVPDGVEIVAADPTDADALRALVVGQLAAIIALGATPGRRTTLFSVVRA
jgi:uncharacterized protein YbjT (DUF2867 family)